MRDLQAIRMGVQEVIWVPAAKALSVRREMTLDEEARKRPEAVFNRLVNRGDYEEAERILDLYV